MPDSLKISIVKLLVLRLDLQTEDVKTARDNLVNGTKVCTKQLEQVITPPDGGVRMVRVNETTYYGSVVNPIDRKVEYCITATVDSSAGTLSTVSETKISGLIEKINHVFETHLDISTARFNKTNKRGVR